MENKNQLEILQLHDKRIKITEDRLNEIAEQNNLFMKIIFSLVVLLILNGICYWWFCTHINCITR